MKKNQKNHKQLSFEFENNEYLNHSSFKESVSEAKLHSIGYSNVVNLVFQDNRRSLFIKNVVRDVRKNLIVSD